MDNIPRDPVPVEKFGKDHWSTFAYIETRCVDYKGVPDRDHMRCDVDRHPGLVNRGSGGSNQKYPTILKGARLENHDGLIIGSMHGALRRRIATFVRRLCGGNDAVCVLPTGGSEQAGK